MNESPKHCPSCASTKVGTEIEQEVFLYGVEEPIDLEPLVPVRNCVECGERWTDWAADFIRDTTIEIHLLEKALDLIGVPGYDK